MLFGRRHKQAGVRAGQGSSRKYPGGRGPVEPAPELFRIDFEMMRKGHVINRGSKKVRQIGVTVDGSTRLVTSGDMVDQATYDALLRAGIIDAPRRLPEDRPAPEE